MRESEIQSQIMAWLDLRRILFWRCALGGVRHAGRWKKNPMTGFPDLAGIMPCGTGRLFAIEVKAKDGRLSAEQELWRERLTAKGVVYILARSLDDVCDTFTAYERFGA